MTNEMIHLVFNENLFFLNESQNGWNLCKNRNIDANRKEEKNI